MLNKPEKLAYAYMLGEEKAALAVLEEVYREALDEINEKIRLLQADELLQNRIYRKQHQEALKGQVEAILERLHTNEYETIDEYLKESYTNGYVAAMYTLHGQGIDLILPIDQDQAVRAIVTNSAISEGLYKSLGVDIKKLQKTISAEISRGIVTNMPFGKIARNISNQAGIAFKRARTIVRTESHRIQEESSQDARVEAKKQGCDIVKQWSAVMDIRTRYSHRRLDGQIREIDEPFEIHSGLTAMQPGGFGVAEEDCNCRCVALTRAKWALDEKELSIREERAKYFDLDKSKDFEDFKEKYLKATETLKNQEKRGTIVLPKKSDDDVLDLATGMRYYLAKGSKLQDVTVFAGKGSKKEFRKAEKYAERYGGSAADWQHVKGIGLLETEDGVVMANIHWVQCEGIGKKEMFVKEWLE